MGANVETMDADTTTGAGHHQPPAPLIAYTIVHTAMNCKVLPAPKC